MYEKADSKLLKNTYKYSIINQESKGYRNSMLEEIFGINISDKNRDIKKKKQKKIYFSLCEIGKRGILCPNLKDTWFKICKDNIWLYVLKQKEEKICFLKIGALLGDHCLLDGELYCILYFTLFKFIT